MMKILKYKYLIVSVIAVTIIILAGGYQLPKYTSRLTLLAVLALLDIIYWLSIRRSISKRFYRLLKISYWFPMAFLLSFFMVGLIAPYTLWPSFLRIYVPAVLMILLIGKGIFMIVLVTGDILFAPRNLWHKLHPRYNSTQSKWMRPGFILIAGSAVSGLVILIFFLGMFVWVNNFKLITIHLPVKDLPVQFDGYKIIQFSDLHLGSMATQDPLKKMVKIVNEQKPDVIFFTGDLVNFTTEEAIPFEKTMKQFSAKDGVYSILGNHDYGEYSQWDTPEAKLLNDSALFDFYDRIGWHLLRNQNSVIRRDSASIAVLGVENWSAIKRFGKKGDIRKALQGTNEMPFKILLSHDPTHWDGEVNSLFPNIGLVLSGHTHAFQIAIEGENVKWSPASVLFKQWAGLYKKLYPDGGEQFLYVNRGAGTLGYPGRIGTRPEITLIILRKAE